MFRVDDSFQNVQNIRRDWLLPSINPIKVLVVDYNKDLLAYVAEVLRSCSFEVTCVDHYGVALRLLTEKSNHYDLLLIDKDLADMDIHTFLKLIKNIDLLAVVMSEQEDDAFIYEVFKNGGFLVIKRPLTDDAVSHIRQGVIRQRMHKHEKSQNKYTITKKATQDKELQNKRSSSTRKKGRYEPKKRVHQSFDDDDDYYDADDDDDDDDDYIGDTSMRKKICVEWTKELHENFVNAYNQLGEGRRFPKKILELMGVPGLTRMQVASHLQVYQKFQKEKLNFSEKRTMSDHAMPSNLTSQELNGKRFGCMASLQTSQEESYNPVGIEMSYHEWQTQQNHMDNQTAYRSSSMMNIPNERNIAQPIEYAQIPFGCDRGINQDDVFGGRITTTTNGYFQRRMLGLRDSGHGSKNHDLSSILIQPSQEFPNFLKDFDYNGPNGI